MLVSALLHCSDSLIEYLLGYLFLDVEAFLQFPMGMFASLLPENHLKMVSALLFLLTQLVQCAPMYKPMSGFPFYQLHLTHERVSDLRLVHGEVTHRVLFLLTQITKFGYVSRLFLIANRQQPKASLASVARLSPPFYKDSPFQQLLCLFADYSYPH